MKNIKSKKNRFYGQCIICKKRVPKLIDKNGKLSKYCQKHGLEQLFS